MVRIMDLLPLTLDFYQFNSIHENKDNSNKLMKRSILSKIHTSIVFSNDAQEKRYRFIYSIKIDYQMCKYPFLPEIAKKNK